MKSKFHLFLRWVILGIMLWGIMLWVLFRWVGFVYIHTYIYIYIYQREIKEHCYDIIQIIINLSKNVTNKLVF